MNCREKAFRHILEHRIIAVIREKNPAHVVPLIDGLYKAGITTIEITLTTPGATEFIQEYAHREDLLMGVGSLLHVQEAEQVFAAGAEFYASPCTDPEIIGIAHDADALAMPGGMTPNELWHAHKAGADLIKVFPMPPHGPAYLRSLTGPMPELRFAPSGGITNENANELLQAGAAALNVGSWLTPSGQDIEERVEQLSRRALLLLEEITTSE